MTSVLWFQGGACSGNTMSFLNASEPSVVDLIVDFGMEVIWHPSLGVQMGKEAQQLFRDCASGKKKVDIFVFEGSVIEGPNGTGRFDLFADRPMKDWVKEMCEAADIVVAIGDCAPLAMTSLASPPVATRLASLMNWPSLIVSSRIATSWACMVPESSPPIP